MFSLKDKSVIITGGGSGIGKAISILFAQQGAIVNILELNQTAAEETANQIVENGGIANAYACDIANQAKVIEIFQQIGNSKGEGAALNNIAAIFYAKEEYGSALEYSEKSLNIRQKIGDKMGEGATLIVLSAIMVLAKIIAC